MVLYKMRQFVEEFVPEGASEDPSDGNVRKVMERVERYVAGRYEDEDIGYGIDTLGRLTPESARRLLVDISASLRSENIGYVGMAGGGIPEETRHDFQRDAHASAVYTEIIPR